MNNDLMPAVPLDMGALPSQTGFEPIISLFQAGGPVVMILMVMSVIALAIIFLKLWQFSSLRLGSTQFVDSALGHWQAGRNGAALEVLKSSPNPVAKVMAIAINGRGQLGPLEATVREEAARVASAELEKLRGNLRGLELIGALSPLLGLLGTVLGMITAFQQLQAAGSRVDPSVLSGGIWEALLTTAVGLAVAIPTVAVLSALERTIERTQHRMEDALTRVFTIDIAISETGSEAKAESGSEKLPSPVVLATEPSRA